MKRPAKMSPDMAQRMAQRQAQYVKNQAQYNMQQANMTPTQQQRLWLKAVTSTPTFSTTASTWTMPTTGTGLTNGTGSMTGTAPGMVWYDDGGDSIDDATVLTIKDGIAKTIQLPDGTVIEVAADGSFAINDKEAKVTYRANRVRDFNPFINASDKLEAFIKFCGRYGVRQKEMLDIPIKLFIGWLIMEAALADNEPAPHEALFNDLKKRLKPRCRCGRFIARKLAERNVMFCRPVCLEKELVTIGARS
jgi:hypothetical protein